MTNPQLALNFALYFGVSLLLWLALLAVYVRITPYPEFRLVAEGNMAAALSLSGSAIGLALPVASLAVHAVSLLDMVVWAAIALFAQIVLWVVLRAALFRALHIDIPGDKRSVGLVLGVLSACLGLLNAACLTY